MSDDGWPVGSREAWLRGDDLNPEAFDYEERIEIRETIDWWLKERAKGVLTSDAHLVGRLITLPSCG